MIGQCPALLRTIPLRHPDRELQRTVTSALQGLKMLELRPNCECCDRELPPDTRDARICTFECTFCAKCADEILMGVCPNCGGNLVERPVRPEAMLRQYPASRKRVLKADGCASID